MRSLPISAPGLAIALLMTLPASTGPAAAQAKLSNIGCGREDALRSVDGTRPTNVTFINQSGRRVRTYWLNYAGKRVFYRELGPGDSYTQQTYVTHPWVITSDGSGDCTALYQPLAAPAIAIIQ